MAMREPIWKHEDFPHYYHNPAAVGEIALAFREELDRLMPLMGANDTEGGISEVLTEETLKNSQIEGVDLDRESVRSSFLNNLPIKGSREGGAGDGRVRCLVQPRVRPGSSHKSHSGAPSL
jgi:hypothetical protein